MDRERLGVGDTVWEKIEALLPGKRSDRGVTAKDNRLFLEAVLRRARAGLPGRDLPPEFGNWNSVFTRFRRRVRALAFDRIFKALSGEPDFEYAMIDGTIVTVHQKAGGAKGGAENNAIGHARAGLTTKIVALVDALGNLVRFVLLPGQRHDTVGVAPLIEGVSFDALLGDKAFDADWLRADLDDRGATAIIPPRSNRKVIIDYDQEMYRWRHLVENCFAKIKKFRSIATRYDNPAESFSANINLAAALIAAR